MKKFLKLMPHAQATVTDCDGTLILQSYRTTAAKLTADGIFTVECWCSPTTRRHVAAFMDEYVHHIQTKAEQSRASTGSYQTCKALFEGHMALDITTGEVIDL